MKGFTKDNKFHPITDYKKKDGVTRKKKEPFAVTRDGVKLSQLDLIQMQRADIGKGRRYAMDMPDPIIETELTDIFGEVSDMESGEIDYLKLGKVVKENIKYILNRERLLGRDEIIEINHVSSRPETGRMEFRDTGKGESGFYQYDYTILKGHKKTNFSGTVYGSISAGDVIDMTLELYKVRNDR